MKVRQRRPRDAGSVVVRKRTGGFTYMLKWRGFTEATPAVSKSEAMALLPAFVAKAQSGEIEREKAAARARGEQPTLSDWSEVFLAQHVSQDPDRLATRAAYGGTLRRQVLPALGSHRLHEITPAMIRKTMQDHFAAGLSINTLKLANAVLRRAFDAAIEDGHPLTNPTPKFSKLRLGNGGNTAETARRSALMAGQVAALLSACHDPDVKLYLATMVSCGLRPGECVGLRWRNVDLEAGVLHVREAAKKGYPGPGTKKQVWIGKPKTASSVRSVAMGPVLVALFVAELDRQEAYQAELLGRDPALPRIKSLLPAAALVFPLDPATAEGLTSPRDLDNMRSRMGRVAKRVGIKTSPHKLRHTHISHAIEGGLSLADTAARAGHSSVATTAKTYVHAVNESQRKAALIGDLLLAPATPNLEQLANADAQNTVLK